MKVVLFDLSDTLYSNSELESQYPQQLYNRLSKDLGISTDEAKNLMKKRKKELEEKTGKHITKVAVMESFNYTRSQVHEEFCKVDPKKYLTPNQKLAEMIQRLSIKYRLGMITNLRRVQVVKTLEALGVDPNLFTVIVGEDDVKNIKPHVEPFQKAVELLNEKPGDCVYVADSVGKDLKPAREVGLKTVLVGDDEVNFEFVDMKVADILSLEEVLPF